MGQFEQAVKEQMLAEFPQFEAKILINTDSGREFDVDRLTHHLCGKMWDAFDKALFDIELKGVVDV
jgi:hypothetical protein